MAFIDEYNFSEIVNESEHIVLKALEKRLNSDEIEDLCKCSECVLDMYTLTLNMVKPRYRSSLLGSMYSNAEISEKGNQEVENAVSKAIEKISKNPSH